MKTKPNIDRARHVATLAAVLVALATAAFTASVEAASAPMPGSASVHARQRAVAQGGCASGICLTVGIALANDDPAECGTATSLGVNQRDQINVCYTLANASGVTLAYHWLRDDVAGEIFNQQSIAVAPGTSYQFNRIITAEETTDITSTWTASPTLAYTFAAGTFDFVDISATGTELSGGDDDMNALTLPFPVDVFGETDQICVGNNGSIAFGGAGCYLPGFNVALPILVPNYFGGPVLFPMWTDLFGGGKLLVQQIGTSPASRFVVEWYQKNHYDDGANDPGGVTFEVVLDEPSGNFSFQYLTTTFGSDPSWDHGGAATVGLQNTDGSSWNQFSYDAPALTDGMAIDWTNHSAEALSAAATVHLAVGAPIADVSPVPLSATAPPGGSANATLTIANDGDRDLEWTLDEAAPRAHFPPPGTRHAMPFHPRGQSSKASPPRPREMPSKALLPRAAAPSRAFAVPAYTIVYSLDGSWYETFDAASPTDFRRIAFYDGQTYAGAFAGDDFTHEYVLSYNTSQLDALDTLTGAVTHIAALPLPAGWSWSSLSWDRTSGTLYGLAGACGVASAIYTIDPASGAYELVGTTADADCMVAIAIDDNGLMYGLDLSADALFAIDKTDGSAALIGSLGYNANYAQDMAFDRASGVLYLGGMDNDANGGIYTVDTTTGAATLIEPLGYLVEVTALDIAVAGGPCARAVDVPWLTAVPASGTTPGGASSAIDVGFDASALAAGTYAADLCVRTNDTHRLTVTVPVQLVVTDVEDAIFADGFEGSP